MSEADRLWAGAMAEAASRLQIYSKEESEPKVKGTLWIASINIQHLPRPAGWGEGGKDE